jgi:glucose-6-phosphate-specific signal transduction histidine kinase
VVDVERLRIAIFRGRCAVVLVLVSPQRPTVQLIAQSDTAALMVEVSDDGPGGANAGGSGLTGLRQRVEALDGLLEIESPAGHGTTVRAALPCA